MNRPRGNAAIMPIARQAFALVTVLGLAGATQMLHAQTDWAKAALDKSPRHHEYVSLKNGSRAVPTFVIYPEVSQKAPVIVLIGEITGLTPWAKEMSDQLAAEGFIVVVPDVLAGAGPNGGGSDSFASQDAVIKAASAISAEQVTGDLDAAADYGKKLPSSNGKLFVVGFCWGGGKAFAYATHRHDLAAAFVFYGESPADVTAITAPVYGFYGEKDARIDAGLPATTEAMKAAGKKFEPVMYTGAGHGYMRAGDDPDAAPVLKTAWSDSFKRLVALLKQLGSGTSAGMDKHLASPVVAKSVVAKSVAAKPVAATHAAKVVEAMSCHEEAPAGTTMTMAMAAKN